MVPNIRFMISDGGFIVVRLCRSADHVLRVLREGSLSLTATAAAALPKTNLCLPKVIANVPVLVPYSVSFVSRSISTRTCEGREALMLTD